MRLTFASLTRARIVSTQQSGRFEVPFISVDDLRTYKLSTGQSRDLVDITDLPKAGAKSQIPMLMG
jgi:hypothetical protein